jgi:hypothetical protein
MSLHGIGFERWIKIRVYRRLWRGEISGKKWTWLFQQARCYLYWCQYANRPERQSGCGLAIINVQE